MVGPEGSEKGRLEDRNGRSYGQCFGFGPISFCGQKSTMAASINLKSDTEHPKGLFVTIMAGRLFSGDRCNAATVGNMARFLNFSTFFKSFILDCLHLDHNKQYWSKIWRQVHGRF